MDLKGLRVLMVEDEAIIAMEMQEFLHECHCVVVGPVGTLEAAIRLARTEELDAAVLDVSLHSAKVFPVAEELRTRGIPFIFATGYGDMTLPEEWRDLPRLDKPFTRESLGELLESIAK